MQQQAFQNQIWEDGHILQEPCALSIYYGTDADV